MWMCACVCVFACVPLCAIFQWVTLTDSVLHINTVSEREPQEAHCQGPFCPAQPKCLRPQLLPGALRRRIPILPKCMPSCYLATSCFYFHPIPLLPEMFIAAYTLNKSSAVLRVAALLSFQLLPLPDLVWWAVWPQSVSVFGTGLSWEESSDLWHIQWHIKAALPVGFSGCLLRDVQVLCVSDNVWHKTQKGSKSRYLLTVGVMAYSTPHRIDWTPTSTWLKIPEFFGDTYMFRWRETLISRGWDRVDPYHDWQVVINFGYSAYAWAICLIFLNM